MGIPNKKKTKKTCYVFMKLLFCSLPHIGQSVAILVSMSKYCVCVYAWTMYVEFNVSNTIARPYLSYSNVHRCTYKFVKAKSLKD